MLMAVFAAAAFTVLVFMTVAAALAFAVMMVMLASATALAFLVLVTVAAASAAAFFFVMMVVMVTAATAAAFLFVMMMVMVAAAAAAATAFLFVMMVVMVAAAAATAFVIMMMVVVVMMTAATAAAAAVGMTFNADRFERFLRFGHFEPDHAEHLGDVGKRKNGKALRCFGHFDAAVDERGGSFLHRAEVARHMKHLFHGGTNHPEMALIVDEDVVDEKRTLFFDSHRHGARIGFKGVAPAHALGGRQNERMGTVENGLGGRRFGRQQLGESRHL